MKTVATYRDPYEARIVSGKLEAEGIPTMVLDENLVNIDWTYSQAIGGVKVQVPEEAFEKASKIIGETQEIEHETDTEASYQPDEEDICPECGSTNTSRRPYSLLSLIVSIVFFVPFFYRKEGRVCKDCGTVWENKDS